MGGGISNLDVTMKEDAARLDEVVILGYGSQRRADVTAAVSQIDGKELQKMPMSNISQGLGRPSAGSYLRAEFRTARSGPSQHDHSRREVGYSLYRRRRAAFDQ